MRKVVVIVLLFIVVIAAFLYTFLHKKEPAEPADMQAFTTQLNEQRTKAGQPAISNPEEALWYKNKLIYTLDVEVFKDSDGDGYGDFKGLTQKLDYIKSLGTGIIWLAPFQPTPNQDDGYDISDYYAIDPHVGTMADYKEFVQQAEQRGMRVIIDFVFNHTSIQHPWFQQSRQAASPYHNWYVWSGEKPENQDKGMVFIGPQKKIWTYDSTARSYYYHRFYNFMPDLNMQNAQVQAELEKVMRYWLQTGIDGLRVDAVTYLTEVPDTKTDGEKFEHQYELLKKMRSIAESVNKKNILLGEASVGVGQNKNFFGEYGDRLNMIFNFYADQCLFYSLATEDVKKFKDAVNDLKEIPLQNTWVYFLRNQDEMGMGKLSKEEQQKVFDAFGQDTSMQVYGRGIRRRLAPMFGNDAQRMKMGYSLMFSLPGNPMIRYGDEIGMGDDLSLPERMAMRTPMQWSDSANAGFSSNSKTVRPVISKGDFDYRLKNVAAQQKDTGSLLNLIIKLSNLRNTYPQIAWGSWKFIETGSPHVIGICYDWQGKSVITIHNFSKQSQAITLKSDKKNGELYSLLQADSREKKEDSNTFHFTMPSYGYNWYELR
jgi:maltose alpha-D-glucosyltransferase / alpha-amylase